LIAEKMELRHSNQLSKQPLAARNQSDISQQTGAIGLEEKIAIVKEALGVETVTLSPEEIDVFLAYLETEQEWTEVYRRLANS
jgi:hypothetical protein